jgi:hypothetical protein
VLWGVGVDNYATRTTNPGNPEIFQQLIHSRTVYFFAQRVCVCVCVCVGTRETYFIASINHVTTKRVGGQARILVTDKLF